VLEFIEVKGHHLGEELALRVNVSKTLMRTFIVLLLFYSLVDVNTYNRTPFLRGSVVVVLNCLDF
jgi:hypothetical protein